MAIYAIGDIQGCYDELMRLLEKIDFDPAKDTLWFAGDLVNRGPNSLQVLRFVRGLRASAVSVLGNHDLHLLAISEGNLKHKSKDRTLDPILKAEDRDELLHWLRHRPLMHHDKKRGFSLVHAGLPPQWDIATARSCAKEVETVLKGKGLHEYCMQMYGNQPDSWSPNSKAWIAYVLSPTASPAYVTAMQPAHSPCAKNAPQAPRGTNWFPGLNIPTEPAAMTVSSLGTGQPLATGNRATSGRWIPAACGVAS